MTNQTCKKCGFEIEPDDLIVVYGMPKHRDCFGAMVDRLEAAERRVAELEAQLATMTIRAIDGIGYYVLPGPGVSTSPSSPPPADSA